MEREKYNIKDEKIKELKEHRKILEMKIQIAVNEHFQRTGENQILKLPLIKR